MFDAVFSNAPFAVCIGREAGVRPLLSAGNMLPDGAYSPFVAGAAFAPVNSTMRSLGDLAGRTVVIQDPLADAATITITAQMLSEGVYLYDAAAQIVFATSLSGTIVRGVIAGTIDLVLALSTSIIIWNGALPPSLASLKLVAGSNVRLIDAIYVNSQYPYNASASTFMPGWLLSAMPGSNETIGRLVAQALLSPNATGPTAGAGFGPFTFPYDYLPVEGLLTATGFAPPGAGACLHGASPAEDLYTAVLVRALASDRGGRSHGRHLRGVPVCSSSCSLTIRSAPPRPPAVPPWQGEGHAGAGGWQLRRRQPHLPSLVGSLHLSGSQRMRPGARGRPRLPGSLRRRILDLFPFSLRVSPDQQHGPAQLDGLQPPGRLRRRGAEGLGGPLRGRRVRPHTQVPPRHAPRRGGRVPLRVQSTGEPLSNALHSGPSLALGWGGVADHAPAAREPRLLASAGSGGRVAHRLHAHRPLVSMRHGMSDIPVRASPKSESRMLTSRNCTPLIRSSMQMRMGWSALMPPCERVMLMVPGLNTGTRPVCLFLGVLDAGVGEGDVPHRHVLEVAGEGVGPA